MELLVLPDIPKPSWIKRILQAFHTFGPEKKVFQELRLIQKKREGSIKYWPKNPNVLTLKNKIDGILVDVMEWCNDEFHPQDSMEALLYSPFIDMMVEETLMEIENLFPNKELFDVPEKSNIWEYTYLEFIENLISVHGYDGV